MQAPVTPQRGGYDNQMQAEQSQKSREAAGKLLPELMKMRDSIIDSMNK